MRNLKIKNIKSHQSQNLAKANASRDLQINFNQAEDALTIPAESRHDHKCGFATQSGRSMIEMLGVLAIIGVLSVGGIAGYSKAMQKYRINKTIEQITLIAGNVRTFFASQKNYEGVYCATNLDGSCNVAGCNGFGGNKGCPIIKKAKILPDDIITVNDGKITSITNLFGYRVYLDWQNKANSGDHQAFSIEYVVDSEEACIELATNDWTVANAEAVRIFKGGINPSGKYTFKLPMDVDTAAERCSAVINMSRSEAGKPYVHILLLFDIDVNSNLWKSEL